MRLVLQYEESDGYTYTCTNTFPIEYESAEQLLVDIEKAVSDYLAKDEFATMTIGKQTIYLDHFIEHGIFYTPRIYTVDEWFDEA